MRLGVVLSCVLLSSAPASRETSELQLSPPGGEEKEQNGSRNGDKLTNRVWYRSFDQRIQQGRQSSVTLTHLNQLASLARASLFLSLSLCVCAPLAGSINDGCSFACLPLLLVALLDSSCLFWSLVSPMAFSRDNSRVAWLSSPQVSSCIVALMMMLALLVGDAAAQSYTLRMGDSIVGTATNQFQGNTGAMSGNGLVSLSISGDGTAPVLAVASSPGATTTKTSLSLPSPCISWGGNGGSVSSSGNMFAVNCVGSGNHVAVYQTSSPSTPFAMINSAYLPALSEDGATLAVVSSSGTDTAIYKLSMGSYTLKQTITPSFFIGTITIAPDASALAVSDDDSQTSIYGWVTSQFVVAPSMPLSVACFGLAASSQSSSGATIACATDSSSSPIYSLVNSMGSLSLSTPIMISGLYFAAAITPDGSTVALSGGSSTIIASATSGSTIATFSEGGSSVAISSDAATVFLGDYNFGSTHAGRAVWYDSNAAPTVALQPMSVSVSLGSTATFTAAATGYVAVQWSFTGSSTRRRSVLGATPIPGATSTSFTTNPTTAAFNGNTYSATFTSAAGVSTTTSAVTLTVTGGSSGSAPVVTSNPASTSVTAGAAATFIAAASGSPTPTVQWQGTLELHSRTSDARQLHHVADRVGDGWLDDGS